MRHVESSSDTESSPRRRGRSCKLPELYYEEQWIEKRTRRRGNLRKLARQDSRSFSEEEIRLSKTSSKKDQRRARSESARYDEDDTDGKLKRKRSKKGSTKSRRESSESSIESDSYDYAEDTSRQKFDSRVEESKTERSNEMEAREYLRKDDSEESVSDDSLEVVVVRKSLEKKCEKVVSGKRSKTPKESSKELKFTKTHRSTKRKSKSKKGLENGDSTSDRMQSFDKEQEQRDSTFHSEETPRTSVDEDKGSHEKIIESRYRRDVTDSTSQETVERVVVTAMVHKDQGPDTPKSIVEKEVTFDDRLRTEVIEMEEGSRDGSSEASKDIVEQSDELSSNLVQKAVSLKKDVEEMRQQMTHEKTQVGDSKEDVKEEPGEEKVKKDLDEKEVPLEKKDESEKGSLDAHETSDKGSPTSQKEYQRRKSQQDELASKSEGTSSETKHDVSEHTIKEDYEESEKASKSESSISQKDAQREDATPRTVVEDVLPSEDDEKKSSSEEAKSASKSKPGTARRRSSFDERRSKSSSSKQSDESPKKSHRRKELKKRESCTKKISVKTSKGVEDKTSDTREADGSVTKESSQSSGKKSTDEKGQTSALRRKSVDFSSSKDSALMEEAEERSLSVETASTTKRKMSVHEEAVQGLPPSKTTLEDQKEEKKVKKRAADEVATTEEESFRYIDESSSSSPKSAQVRRSRPSTGKVRKTGRSRSSVEKKCLFESSEERSPDRSAIVAVIESPEWDDEDEEIDKEIRDAIGEDGEHETEPEEDNEMGVVRVLPSTSEEEMSRVGPDVCKTSATDSLPQVQSSSRIRLTRVQSPQESRTSRLQGKQRRDSGGRDSGIEPSPRVSRIPRRRIMKCCPNTDKQQSLNMDTITRDVQISLRRYHLERKIFFQLMELKRLQIRHGRANEQVLVKRQVEAFHKAGMSGPTLGVAKYDQPLTFRHFEAFLYDQLRKLQKRPATPDFCTEAKQCTQKTHRCHHATSAYTSFPVYTYLGGGGQEQADLLPKIESRGKGQMTVEVTHGEEKQIIALPAERLDRTKKYYVTFTVKGEAQHETEKPKSSTGIQRHAKSV
ncbi:nucleolar protein dao-5-like [Ceratina calcarata]|uniref:Nucleolar protein dao-5-like n=1 Tax=Ceratina calcarata TaxID=156304 RepID=A0AAJ7WAK8_9HYME|nr:nucleolar protein dao-5-like [Ceratina calcarata]